MLDLATRSRQNHVLIERDPLQLGRQQIEVRGWQCCQKAVTNWAGTPHRGWPVVRTPLPSTFRATRHGGHNVCLSRNSLNALRSNSFADVFSLNNQTPKVLGYVPLTCSAGTWKQVHCERQLQKCTSVTSYVLSSRRRGPGLHAADLYDAFMEGAPRRGRSITGRLKSDQGQLFYEFQLSEAVPKDRLVRMMLLSIFPPSELRRS
jgi:hypothetical protein